MSEEHEPTLFEELAAPFPPTQVSWRVGAKSQDKKKGMCLAYIDARDVMERLDNVVGQGGWQSRYINAGNGATCCEVGIRIDGEWVWKSDGAGKTDYEGDKGQFSDAFKRAAVKWGVGRYLYNLDAPWVELTDRGYITEAARENLDKMLFKVSQNIEWGDRTEQNTYRLLLNAIKSFCQTGEAVDEFIEINKSVMGQLPVALKKQLWQEMQRIKEEKKGLAA